jgi:hypothetical protein
LIKETIHQRDITVVNMYTLDFGMPSFIKQTLLGMKEYINSNMIIVGGFNILLLPIGHPDKRN